MFLDLRFAVRSLRRRPGLSGVVILTLALAIGANTAIFSLLDGLLLAPVPVRNPQSLLLLKWQANQSPDGFTSTYGYGDCNIPNSETGGCTFSLPFYRELAAHARTLAQVTAYAANGGGTIVADGHAFLSSGQMVAGNFFRVMGLKPYLGRFISPSDDRTSAPAVMVLSYPCWQKYFHASPATVGETVALNRHPVTIIGVAPPSFAGLAPGSNFGIWIPLSMRSFVNPFWTPADNGPGEIWLILAARARHGVSAAAVQAEVSGMWRAAMLAGPKPIAKPSDNPHVVVLHAQQALSGARAQSRTPVLVLFYLVAAILLIACANVAGLLVARAQARDQEFAIRRALGAGRVHILRQLLTESLLLAIAGGILGLGMAILAAHALIAMITRSMPYFALHAPLDARVLLFALGVTVGAGILSGVLPAWLQGFRPSLRVHSRARPLHWGNVLVVAQVALCLVVLAGAGLLVRTLTNLRSIDPGFDTRNLLLFSIDGPSAGYNGARAPALLARIQRGMAALPGVEHASYSEMPLLAGDLSTNGGSITPGGKHQQWYSMPVGLGFFQTMGIHLLAGRRLRASDFVVPPAPGAKANRDAPPMAVIVNEQFARQFFGHANPLGRDFSFDKSGAHPHFTVVGIVSNAKYQKLRENEHPIVYGPAAYGFAEFELRTAASPLSLLPAVRRTLHNIDPDLPLGNPTTESETINTLLFRERLLARLASLFAALALLLAAIGIYALLAQEVTRRTREIGIRMALGAERRRVIRMVIARGAVLAIAGNVAGLAGAVAATRYLHSMLYGVKATDPVTLSAVGAILFVVALLACWLPARRASRVDPMVALRYE